MRERERDLINNLFERLIIYFTIKGIFFYLIINWNINFIGDIFTFVERYEICVIWIWKGDRCNSIEYKYFYRERKVDNHILKIMHEIFPRIHEIINHQRWYQYVSIRLLLYCSVFRLISMWSSSWKNYSCKWKSEWKLLFLYEI